MPFAEDEAAGLGGGRADRKASNDQESYGGGRCAVCTPKKTIGNHPSPTPSILLYPRG